MNKYFAQSIIGVAGFLAIGYATYITKDSSCLLGILLLCWLIKCVD